MSSNDNTDCINEPDGDYDSEHDSDRDMYMEDDMDAPYGVDLHGDVDIEMGGNNQEKEDEEEENEKV
jgi:hypothetical protein